MKRTHAPYHSLIRFWLAEVNLCTAPLMVYLTEVTMESHNKHLQKKKKKNLYNCR